MDGFDSNPAQSTESLFSREWNPNILDVVAKPENASLENKVGTRKGPIASSLNHR